MAGWNVKITHVKLDPPVQTDDGPITEGVGRITWTAERPADGIPVGGFQDFGLEVLVPGKAGEHADVQGAADLQQRHRRALDRRRRTPRRRRRR